MGNAPTALDFGYVFLSDNGGQAGLLSSAERINAIRSELASVTPNVVVVAFGGEPYGTLLRGRRQEPPKAPSPRNRAICGRSNSAISRRAGWRRHFHRTY